MPSNICFFKCRRDIAASLNDFSDRWCKRENVEPDALKKWKINIFKIIDTRISFWFVKFLDGDVPRSTSYGVYIFQLIRFATASSYVADFNT